VCVCGLCGRGDLYLGCYFGEGAIEALCMSFFFYYVTAIYAPPVRRGEEDAEALLFFFFHTVLFLPSFCLDLGRSGRWNLYTWAFVVHTDADTGHGRRRNVFSSDPMFFLHTLRFWGRRKLYDIGIHKAQLRREQRGAAQRGMGWNGMDRTALGGTVPRRGRPRRRTRTRERAAPEGIRASIIERGKAARTRAVERAVQGGAGCRVR